MRCRLDPNCEGNKLRGPRGGAGRCFQTGRYSAMKIKAAGTLAIFAWCMFGAGAFAQDLGPQVKKLADGVYVHTGKGFESNSGIILTQEGVVVIDTGQNPIESRDIMATVKKLTPLPVRLVIDTEPHGDHTTGHFVFSPPALVVAAAGAGESMRGADRAAPDRIQRLSASAFVVNQVNILRPFVTIPDILAAGKMMKALNPEHVVPGHGTPGTVKIFEDGEKYYALLLDRVGAMVKAGKSLDDIKKEVKMPEYSGWGSQDRFPTNVEAAYKA